MNDHESLFGERTLSTFYDALSRDQVVTVGIQEQFGSEAQDILDGIRSGLISPDQEDELKNLLLYLLGENGRPAVELVGRGDFDEFPIAVMHFGPVFWVTAMEFDDIGFFGNAIAASEAATTNFEPFITHAAEQSRQNT